MFLNIKIKEARLEKKMTQQQLADELTLLNRKTSNTVIANWESGLNSPDVNTLELICKILNKDGNYFFDTQTFEDSVTLNTIQSKYGISSTRLLDNYAQLNHLGKETANIYVESLTKVPEYTETKNDSSDVKVK